MEKSDVILNLISEKSGLLNDELSNIVSNPDLDKDIKESLINLTAEKIELLDNLYEEIRLIISS